MSKRTLLPTPPREPRPRVERGGGPAAMPPARRPTIGGTMTLQPRADTTTPHEATGAFPRTGADLPFTIDDIDRVLALATGRKPEARPRVIADAVVRARGLTRRYGKGDAAVDALRDATVEFERGRFTAVMGPSGSGKSTLMHLLAGLDQPSSGSVEIDGVEITRLKERQLTQAAARQGRLHLPVVQPAAHAQRRREPDAAAHHRRTLGRPPAGSASWSTASGWATGSSIAQPSFRAASSSASPSPGRWSQGRRCCSPTSPRATSTRAPVARSCRCCAARSTSSARPSSWSPTTPARRPSPTACCSSRTARIVLDRDRMSRDEIFDTIKALEGAERRDAAEVTR